MAKSERFADLGAGARFFVVSLGGVIVDIAIGWALVELFGLPLWLGATVGFAVAAAGNYAAHELWTFRAAGAGLSARRALQYVGAPQESTAPAQSRGGGAGGNGDDDDDDGDGDETERDCEYSYE